MEVIAAIGAWALGAVPTSSNAFPGFILKNFSTPRMDILSELGPSLSSNASIFLPGSQQFTNATTRWQVYDEPNITVVVQVATESDVQETIKYANQHRNQFLAVSGGHGAINSLASVNHGIEIWMRQMNSIEISPDGKSATIGGGVKAKEVTDALWAVNKQTVTGTCECTGVLGPMLGGGHGILQGRYGLLADNLISARMVLANGTAITISSDSNPDLFWAVRGAGHNFGIVTEFTYKIYDVGKNANWAYESFIFTNDKLEELYEQLNILTNNGTQPVELWNFSYFISLPVYDPDNPVIFLAIAWEGASTIPDQYAAPFRALGAVMHISTVIPYPQVAVATGNGDDAPVCGHGTSTLRFPISVESYNIPALRAVYNSLRDLMNNYPAFNGSLFLFEGYAVQGVKAIPDDSTAFAHRQDNLLISPVIIYVPNAKLDSIAIQFGKDVRQILHEADGSAELHAYVNYAHGDETLQQIYGYEDWRQERLKSLKMEYDPFGKFSFYAPIH